MKKKYFFGLLFLYGTISLYLAATTPITPHEAKHFYASGVVSSLIHAGTSIVSGFLGLRIIFLGFAFLSIGVFYALSRAHFSKEEDAYFATVLFMFLPGILTASALANIGIVVLSLVLLFVFFYERKHYWILPLIMLSLFFVHEASIIFFIALFLYSMKHKENMLAILSASFILAFFYLAKGIDVGGRPSGHFIEIFGLYAAVFSPLLFLYFFYTMYRILLRGNKTLMWYISFTALAVSLLLSLRQKIYITDFAPYVMISTIAMVDLFMQSLRVRLPDFQKKYIRGMYIVISFLIISIVTLLANKMLFHFTKDQEKHFAYRIYSPYYLANELKEKGIACYDAKGRIVKQLRYYGIEACSHRELE